jgi:hypothetical protein
MMTPPEPRLTHGCKYDAIPPGRNPFVRAWCGVLVKRTAMVAWPTCPACQDAMRAHDEAGAPA